MFVRFPPDKDAMSNKRIIRNEEVPSSFNLKKNSKKYSLHHVGFPGTWQIDIMFGQANAFLVAIEVNTRYLYIIRTNIYDYKGKEHIKSGYALSFAISTLIYYGWNPSLIISDKEPGLESNLVIKLLYQYQIKHKQVYLIKDIEGKNHSNHTSLSIVDRVIRSCRRWLIDNGNEPKKLPMDEVFKFVLYYNNRPHSTLCKIFNRKDITPKMVHESMEMELEVIRNRLMENQFIRKFTPNISLPEGTKVKLYNPPDSFGKRDRITRPDPYKVIKNNGNIYTVKNLRTNEEEYYPRIWLDYL